MLHELFLVLMKTPGKSEFQAGDHTIQPISPTSRRDRQRGLGGLFRNCDLREPSLLKLLFDAMFLLLEKRVAKRVVRIKILQANLSAGGVQFQHGASAIQRTHSMYQSIRPRPHVKHKRRIRLNAMNTTAIDRGINRRGNISWNIEHNVASSRSQGGRARKP